LVKSKWLRKWLSLSLTAILVLSLAPGSFAAAEVGTILESKNAGANVNAAEKIDAELAKQFDADGYVTYLVKMSEQVNTEKVSKEAQALSMSKQATPAAQKLAVRNAVVNSLRETADRTQRELVKFLDQMSAAGKVSKYTSFYIVNGMAVTSTKDVMEKIASFQEVEKILPNRQFKLDDAIKTDEQSVSGTQQPNVIEWNIEQVGAPQVWEMGIDGSGIVVANMDTGVQYEHPALQRKWRGNGSANPELSWWDPFTSSATPVDGHGHGTHTMGTMVGSEANGSNQIGVAPGAQWIAARIFDSAGSTTEDIIIRGAEWILAPKDRQGNLHPELAPDVVNNSWGNTAAGQDEFLRPLVQAWRSAGIFPEFSAGNTNLFNPGGPGSIVAPANYPESFATAATDINRNLASFSLRGPTPYGETKPEISAPGVNVRSSVPGGYEGGWSGTSMAGPHVSGAVALLLQANASLTVDQLEEILTSTAVPLTDSQYPNTPNNGYGWGLLDVYAAVSSVASGLGNVSGYVMIDGEDTEAPVLEHTPITDAFAGMDLPLTAHVTDNVSVVSVEAFTRVVGESEWTSIPMTRKSGDFKDGIYEGVIPAALIDTAGIEYYFHVNDYGNNGVDSPVNRVNISNGVTPGYFQDFEHDAYGYTSGGSNNSWQWGVPTSGPGRAYSGEKLMATNLTGNYQNNSNSYMRMPPVDLTQTHDGAFLYFKHWYDLETNYDKGSIQIAPAGGQFVKVAEFTGASNGWKNGFVDLTPYLGQQIFITFNLNTDGSVTKQGWYIDDIAVLGTDDVPPAAPTGLTADADALGNVTLTWNPVSDIDLKEYVVFRSNESGTGYQLVGTIKSTTLTDMVTEAGTYYYIVKAKDYSNNLSAPSNEAAVTVTPPINIFSDNFDGPNDNGWTHSGAQDSWQRGVPTAGPSGPVSPPNVWATNLSGDYANNANCSLVSPVISLKNVNNATLAFMHWYELETNWDKGFVEITKNGGTTWTQLAVYSHSTNGMVWAPVSINLNSYVGNDVQIRFRLQTDGSVVKKGWYIDNFRVVSASVPTSLGETADPNADLSKPKPSETALLLQLTGADHAALNQKASGTIGVQGLPIAATVTVLETGRSTKTDPATGGFNLIHAAGDFTLRAETYGYYPDEAEVTIIDGETVNVNFTLQPKPHGTIMGRVTDERSGEAIAGAKVMVMEDAVVAPVYTNENGEFTLGVLAGEYTLSVSARDYNGKQVQVNVQGDETITQDVALEPIVGFGDVIAYDDGTSENAVVYNVADAGIAVRMTPQQGPVMVTGALMLFDHEWPVPGGTAIKYAVYDASGANGTPGQMIAGPFNGTAKRDQTWTDLDLDTPVTVNGDFYIVYLQVGTNPNAPGLALDDSSPNAQRSWQLVNGAWSRLDPDYGNAMIRAKVKYLVDAPVLTSPESGIVVTEPNITVTGTSSANGATIYLYNGNERVGEGIVENQQFSIETTLHKGENRLSAAALIDGKLTQRSNVVVVTYDDGTGGEAVNVTAQPSKDQVNVEEPFTVGIDFSQAEDLYAAQFSLTYDAGLTKGSVTPSDELAAYQAEHNPDTGLIVNEKVVDLGNGKVRSDYLLTLAGDFAGYDGSGALATFNFASQTAGDFNFELSNVRLLDSNGEDIELGEITSGTVRVTSGGGPDPGDDYVITGTITAEAFGEGVDYSETWYEGADGVHKVVVEALDAEGHVAKIGTVNADGSYRLSVRAGNYTIRVVVPGHFGAAESVVADANKSVNFGPLTAGDVNGDGVIDLKDLQQAAKAFGKAAPWSDARSSAADINRDSTVDLLDISFILNNYGLQR